MEVHFTAETEEKLEDVALQSGHGTPERLVQDVVEGYCGSLRGPAKCSTAAMTT